MRQLYCLRNGHRGLELKKDCRCIITRFVIPRAHESPPYMAVLPTRFSTITPTLLHAVLILSRISGLSSLWAAYGHSFESESCIEFSQSASLSRQWETYKGLPILTSTNEAFASKISVLHTWPSNDFSRVDIRSLIDLLRGVSLADEHRW